MTTSKNIDLTKIPNRSLNKTGDALAKAMAGKIKPVTVVETDQVDGKDQETPKLPGVTP